MKVGDLARLKTEDGPWMVIDTIGESYDGVRYFCIWYDSRSGKFIIEPFAEAVLTFVDEVEVSDVEVGMVVEIRSGEAPNLVVEKIHKNNNGVNTATCVWWNMVTNKHVRDDFSVHVLRPDGI